MAKKSGAGFFLEKGEKLIFGVGVAVAGLLVLFGLMALTDAADPTAMIKNLNTAADRVTQEVNNDKTGEVPPLPEWVRQPAGYKRVGSADFPLVGPPFEPVHQPDMLRENPRVLTPIGYQLDFIRAPMRSLDIQIGADGEPLLGVLFGAPVQEKDRGRMLQALNSVITNVRNTRPGRARTRPPAPGQQPPGQQPPGGIPGGPMSGEGMPPGGFTQRDDRTVRYLTPEEVQKGQYPLAETVYPLQAVLVHAVFPVKAQIDEIKRALRLRSAQEAVAEAQAAGGPAGFRPPGGPIALGQPQPRPFNDDGEGGGGNRPPGMGGPGMPGAMSTLGQSLGLQFAGFEVQRRVITPSGQDLGWAPFNHEDEYFTKIRARKIADEPDQGYLLPFLRYDQRMAAPLPQLAENLDKYPSIKIPVIVEAIRKLQSEGVTVPSPTDFENRFKNTAGDTNPYAPFGSAVVGGGLGGPGAPAAPVAPARAFPQPGAPGFGGPGFGGPGMVGPGGIPGTPGAAALPDVENTLIRFLDPSVDAGYTYQYQIRVKMKNPNFGKANDVQRKSDATEELLTGPWWTVPETITMPTTSHMYAFDPAEYLKESDTLVKEVGRNFINQSKMKALMETKDVSEGRRAVVQVQQWLPQVRASGDRSEPVGTWVSAEIPVGRGEFIGKRQLIKLPLWSSAAHGYVIRDLSGGVKVAGLTGGDSNQPKGWPITFRTKTLLVDFDGGQVRQSFGNKEVRDESATEMLLLRPDGKLELKSSAVDMELRDRADRDKTWSEWIERVKTRKEEAATGGPNGPKNQFNRE